MFHYTSIYIINLLENCSEMLLLSLVEFSKCRRLFVDFAVSQQKAVDKSQWIGGIPRIL